jgi:hypothetical protein
MFTMHQNSSFFGAIKCRRIVHRSFHIVKHDFWVRFFNLVLNPIRGAVNGLAMTATSALRTIAPTFAGSLFAWSISSSHPFALGAALTFFALAGVFVISLLMGCMVPLRLEKQYASE